MFLQSLLHSPRALLSRYKRWLNKVSNLKIHWWFGSHCLVTSLLRLRYIMATGQSGTENDLWLSINRPFRAVCCYLWAGRAAKVLARAISTRDWNSPDWNGLIESSRPKRLRLKRLKTKRLRPKRPDRVGQPVRSCSAARQSWASEGYFSGGAGQATSGFFQNFF